MKSSQFINDHKDHATSKKRVIVFSAELLFLSETFIYEQTRSLKNWHPILVGDRLVPDGLSLDGLETCLLRSPEEGRFRRWAYIVCHILGLPHLPSVWRLRKLGASLVHVHFGTTAVDIWPTVRALGLPMLVTLHGYDINTYREWWESGKGGWRRKRYPRRLLQMANEPRVNFIAVSNAIRDRAIAYGIPAEKITVRYIGVDTRKFLPGPILITSRSKRILYVGRLVENKGAEYLIRAFTLVHRNIRDAELVIAGEGELRSSLVSLATSLGVPVTFKGALSHDEVIEQMQAARLLCLPSITIENGAGEALGLVLLEAQASGLPVVCFATGGTKEALIDGKTGYLVVEKNIKDLARRLQMLLIDDHLCRMFSANAVKFTRESFDIYSCSSVLENNYDDIINSNKSQ